jgi:hypothetical protein
VTRAGAALERFQLLCSVWAGKRSSAKLFHFDIVLLDKHGDGGIRRFWFVVNDEAAPFGVLQVEYVEID